MKPRKSNFIRNAMISSVVLLVLFVGAGVTYTWYIGQNGTVGSAAFDDMVDTKTINTIKHAKPAANAKVGVSVQMITSPIAPGSNASITVRTNSEATCTIKVIYDKTPSTDSGLTAKIADEYGMASWTWMVETTAPLGKWPVTVTCSNGANSGVGAGDLEIVGSIKQ